MESTSFPYISKSLFSIRYSETFVCPIISCFFRDFNSFFGAVHPLMNGKGLELYHLSRKWMENCGKVALISFHL